MTILVTAASGHLGRLVVDALLARGTQPSHIVAGARDPEKIAELRATGVTTVEVDYSRPETLTAAFDGVDSVLLVSSSEVGRRAPQHQNVIDAAVAAGVAKFVYTSATRATTGGLTVAPEHKVTEEAIAASGLPSVILRNNWYTENYGADLRLAAQTGVLVAAAGDGRVASASRADYAEAAAVALVEDGHLGQIYELGGDVAWNYDELAAAMSEVLDRPVEYQRVSPEERAAGLAAAGLDEGMAGFLVGVDANIRDGELDLDDRTLSRLIGRPTSPLVDGLRASALD